MARGGDVGGLSMISLQACKGIGWGVDNVCGWLGESKCGWLGERREEEGRCNCDSSCDVCNLIPAYIGGVCIIV